MSEPVVTSSSGLELVEPAGGYRVLARKYRPQTFDQLIGQNAMVRTLSNAFETSRIPQAWILTGVRGVGKTTTARILARALNYELPDGSATGFILLMLVTSGLAHLPPIKVVTILSGVIGVNIWVFIISAIIARGARFWFLAWLLRRYGEPIRHFIEKRLGLIAAAGAGALILLYLLYKLLT